MYQLFIADIHGFVIVYQCCGSGVFSDPVFSSQIQDPTTTKRGGKTIACFTVFEAISSPTKLIII
jgi:hypothetical protein